MSVEFISNKDHYDKVVARVASVKKSLWIGTADIKDFHMKSGNSTEPFFSTQCPYCGRRWYCSDPLK